MDIKVSVSFEVQARTFTRPPDPFGERPMLQSSNHRTAECNYCQASLKKISTAKTKSLRCDTPFTVRTCQNRHWVNGQVSQTSMA